MPHPPLTRHAWRAALALAASLSTACGDPKPPPTPDPPQVTLTVPEGNFAGTGLKLVVTVSGCDTVTRLVINDRDTPLKTFPYSGGTVTLDLLTADIPFASLGVAASMALNAEATCDDDRKNRSQPQPAYFFPVAREVADPQGGQLFAHPLVVEGSGTTAAFIGCGKPGTGLPTLSRMTANGEVRTLVMPTSCTPETVITPRNPATGKRWVWTPGVTAFALDSNFTITARTNPTVKVSALTVMDNGDALVVDSNIIRRLTHESGDSVGNSREVWAFEPPQIGPLLAPPHVRVSDGRVLHATQILTTAADRADILVEEVDPNSGTLITRRLMRNVFTSGADVPVPAGAFSEDGSTLYLGFPLAGDQGQVVACVTTATGCTGGSARWTSPVLAAPIRKLVPYGGNTRVAAVGAQRVWLLDDASGLIRNKDKVSFDANGALHVLHVLRPRPSSTELFFLTAPARRLGEDPKLPQEIFAVDQGSNGDARELFRYQVPVSMGAAVDDDGRLWLRSGGKLVQALTTSEYRRFRP